MITISECIINFIISKGNNEIFGIQGVPNLSIFVSAYEKGLKFLNNTSENHSIYSALGMYEESKKIQFVILTIGPGVLGGLKALGNCYVNNIPIFLITPYNRNFVDNFGEHHSVGNGNDEINTLKILDSFTSFNIELKDVNSIIGLLNKAYDYAIKYKKPVNISIPYDMLFKDINKYNIKNINEYNIKNINEYNIKNIDNVIFILGDNVSKDIFEDIISKGFFYFIVGNNIKSFMLSNNYLGVLKYSNNNYLDILINKGIIKNIIIYNIKGSFYNLGFLENYSNINIYHYGQDIINKCYYFYGKKIKYYFSLINDKNFKFLFNKILLKNKLILQNITNKYKESYTDNNFYFYFSNILNEKINNTDIFISVGGYEEYGKKYLNNKSNNYYYSSKFLDMGQVFKAIGYSYKNKQNILCIIGDGNFLMNMGELNTINELGIKISIIIFNNNGYKSLYKNYNRIFNKGDNYHSYEPFNHYKKNIDFKYIAKAFDFNYMTFDDFKNENIDFKNKNLIEIKEFISK